LHRTETGDWVWSSDENDSSSDDDDDSPDDSPDDNADGIASNAAKKSASSSPALSSGSTVNIVLRMRNPKKELNDIRFEYQPKKDTAEGIAQELLGELDSPFVQSMTIKLILTGSIWAAGEIRLFYYLDKIPFASRSFYNSRFSLQRNVADLPHAII
jgi:hypothetical protein